MCCRCISDKASKAPFPGGCLSGPDKGIFVILGVAQRTGEAGPAHAT